MCQDLVDQHQAQSLVPTLVISQAPRPVSWEINLVRKVAARWLGVPDVMLRLVSSRQRGDLGGIGVIVNPQKILLELTTPSMGFRGHSEVITRLLCVGLQPGRALPLRSGADAPLLSWCIAEELPVAYALVAKNAELEQLDSRARVERARQHRSWDLEDEKAAELQLSRPAKQPRLEALGISSLLLDEPPTLEVGDSFMGVSAVQRILAIHDVALAMVGSCHLARLKSYSSKFMHFLSQRYEASSGLRPPTILEAQQADCKLWQGIYALVLEKDWNLNDAIFEYTEVRGDMSNLLQARARPPPSPRFMDKGFKGKGLGRFMSEHWKGQGSDGKGKGPGKDKGFKGKPSGQGSAGSWVKHVQVNGESKQLCMQWQSGKCSRGASCAFLHNCAFPRSDGSACMSKSHNALNHASTAH
ncbi:unnamed protein product [Symbiodinium sp. CCMP2592]|nr:unnamed protein product [Symbiodinium sp. CCMP2592]